MTKADLVESMKEKAQLSTKAEAAKALDAILEVITEGLQKGEDITFTGFGSFKVAERAARTGRNPQTGEEIQIPAAKVVKFSMGKFLKDAMK